MRTLESELVQKEQDLRTLFPQGSGVNIESLIRAYHQLHDAKVYPFGRPASMLKPESLCATNR